MIRELVGKIQQDLPNVEKNTETQMIVDHFNRTLNYLKQKAANESSRFHGLSF